MVTAVPQSTAFGFPWVSNYEVRESSFFRKPGRTLPMPADVCRRSVSGRNATALRHIFLRPPVLQHYRHLGLAVKYGNHVSIDEAHCLMFVRRHCPRVPVPGLLAWKQDAGQTFLYMEDVRGHNAACRGDLSATDHAAIAAELTAVADALQAVPQTLVSTTPFVGHVNGGPLRDWVFVNSAAASATAPVGPFAGVEAFHDWFATAYGSPAGGSSSTTRRARHHRAELPDDVPVVLTHGDLCLGNVLLAPDRRDVGPVRVIAVVDWGQAGWYPSYWEAHKLAWPLERALLRSMHDTDRDQCEEAWSYFVVNAAA